MARCLNPVTIPNPARWQDRQLRFVTTCNVMKRYGRENLRPVSSDVLTVPCGKCLNCLKNRQSQMVVRCLTEAKQRGSFGFMTLTYDDDHLPLVESMWKVNLRTGEECQVESSEFVSTGFHPEKAYLDLFRGVEGSPAPRYRMFEHCNIFEWQWQIRITPSVCRLDVRQWLKQARIQYKRDFGVSLPDFSYVAISEYGSRTCRPHYHLAFFGLKRRHLDYLLDYWKFGKVKQVRMVAVINKDRSSGFIKASKYIGKYMQKGVFECDSVKCGDAQRPRVCQSVRFGTRDIESFRRFTLCFDMVGPYDPFTLKRQDGSELSSFQVDSLIREIPRRLVYRVDEDTVYPLPRIIRDKIFNTVQNDEWLRTAGVDRRRPASSLKFTSPLWCMVAAAIRDKHAALRAAQLEQFCSEHSERTVSENAVEFALFEAYSSGVDEASLCEDYRTFYSRSHF